MNSAKTNVRFSLKGGVLAIGSLFWQDHLYEETNTIRKDWRMDSLSIDSAISVGVPIRYGRLSLSPIDKLTTYTMVFDNRLRKTQYGTAKAIPLSRGSSNDFDSIKEEVRRLSEVEGEDHDFIKGSSAWAICSILLNPCSVRPRVKNHILDRWTAEFEQTPEKHRTFHANQHNGSHYSVKPSGELDIPWPAEAKGMDFLLAAATKPVPRETLDRLSACSIAQLVPNRPYFYENVQHGITTFQDRDILACLHKETRGQSRSYNR